MLELCLSHVSARPQTCCFVQLAATSNGLWLSMQSLCKVLSMLCAMALTMLAGSQPINIIEIYIKTRLRAALHSPSSSSLRGR